MRRVTSTMPRFTDCLQSSRLADLTSFVSSQSQGGTQVSGSVTDALGNPEPGVTLRISSLDPPIFICVNLTSVDKSSWGSGLEVFVFRVPISCSENGTSKAMLDRDIQEIWAIRSHVAAVRSMLRLTRSKPFL